MVQVYWDERYRPGRKLVAGETVLTYKIGAVPGTSADRCVSSDVSI